MMEHQQQHPLDICVLEAAATLVAEQMLPEQGEDDTPPPPLVAAPAPLIKEHEECPLISLNDNVKDTKEIFLSAAEARKRRKKIITSHRKANEHPAHLVEQATKDAVSAVLDNLSMESSPACLHATNFKRKHDDMSKTVETALQELEVLEVDIAPIDRSTSPQNAAMTNHPVSSSSAPEMTGTLGDIPPSIPPLDSTTASSLLNLSSSDSDNNNQNNKKKTQVRYEPAVPMDKDQLTAWRREARRVRNRESAAASRMKTKERIQELEEQVGCWKQKYLDAVHRLQELQQEASVPPQDGTDDASLTLGGA